MQKCRKIEYIWRAMCERCCNPENKDYEYYGGRGIKICNRWLNSRIDFENDMGPRPVVNGVRYSIERIDVNGDYCPENCKWGTDLEQANNKRHNVFIEYNGEKHTISEWSRITDIKPATLLYRLRRGWTPEQILNKEPFYGQKIVKTVDVFLYLEYNGENLRLQEWSDKTGISVSVILRRRRLGWTLEEIFTTPVRQVKKKTKKD